MNTLKDETGTGTIHFYRIEREAPTNFFGIRKTFGIVSISALIIIVLAIILAVLTGCAQTRQEPRQRVGTAKVAHHSTLARITYYTGRHERVAMNGHRAVAGETAAAHPKYHFHQKITIPQLYQYLGETEFEVQDRGKAVTARKAAHGKVDVFDIYVKNYRTMKWLEKSAPEYMTVEL